MEKLLNLDFDIELSRLDTNAYESIRKRIKMTLFTVLKYLRLTTGNILNKVDLIAKPFCASLYVISCNIFLYHIATDEVISCSFVFEISRRHSDTNTVITAFTITFGLIIHIVMLRNRFRTIPLFFFIY